MVKANHGFIYFHETGCERMTSKLKSHHQMVLSTVQETGQGVCKAIFSHGMRWWEALLLSILCLYSGKEDLTNSTRWHLTPLTIKQQY